jgi:WhiB family redox-sensing transcriptional regulator
VIEAGWSERAACRGGEVDDWYAGPTTLKARAARAVCARCPVRARCLAEARDLERDFSIYSRWGLWAGTTPRQRLAMAQGQGHGTEQRDPDCRCGPCRDQQALEHALTLARPPGS